MLAYLARICEHCGLPSKYDLYIELYAARSYEEFWDVWDIGAHKLTNKKNNTKKGVFNTDRVFVREFYVIQLDAILAIYR